MSLSSEAFDASMMRRAVESAYRGYGFVEPNPMVGCIVVKDGMVLSEAIHERFGGPHAEVNAFQRLSPEQREGSTVYVTLEPCSHFGKTPPCVDLVIASKPKRVVIGVVDPFPQVAGASIERLKAAGIQVDVGIEAKACKRLIAPFAKRHEQGLPWIIGKWAMTLDGRMATHTGDSKWITGESARQHVHQVRGKLDAIIVGIGTALADDPLLTARPAGPRIAKRIVFDSRARLPLQSQLVKTAREIPTLIACGPDASASSVDALRHAGCDVWQSTTRAAGDRVIELLRQLSQEGCTNLLIDGGPKLLGSFFDQGLLDEVHIYLGRRLVGGQANLAPNLGTGVDLMSQAEPLIDIGVESFDGDLFVRGFVE